LREAGLVEAQNIAIDYRFANGRTEQLATLAADLVDRNVSLIVAGGGAAAAIAATTATASIPIVFVLGNDPVGLGLVASLDRPGGNVTGVTFATAGLMSKKLALLHELVPQASRVGYLAEDPQADRSNIEISREIEALKREMQAAADLLGRQLIVAEIGPDRGYEAAFTSFAERRADVLVVAPSPRFANDADDIINLATTHEIPTIYPSRAYVVANGLMSYGARQPDAWRPAGVYVGQILKGAMPAEMPVMHASTLELVVNRPIAKAFDLPLSPALLRLADEVIE
jgi:ABC-type uncharacterized transport system substrate-binding protein